MCLRLRCAGWLHVTAVELLPGSCCLLLRAGKQLAGCLRRLAGGLFSLSSELLRVARLFGRFGLSR